MPLQRLAVATIVICIGILLLSACGLPLGPGVRASRPAPVHIPVLGTTWRGSADDARGNLYAVTLDLRQKAAENGLLLVTGTLTLTSPAEGSLSGRLDAPVVVDPAHGPTTLVFHTESGRALTLTLLSPVLSENPHALATQTRVEGAPYNGSPLDAVLSSAYPQQP